MSEQSSVTMVIVGTAICTIGIVALCASLVSALPRERLLLWFGMFAWPYGFALVFRSLLISGAPGVISDALLPFVKLIGLAAGVPALLLFQEFYGKGWRRSSKWIMWSYASIVLTLLGITAMHEPGGLIPSPGIALVIFIPLALLLDRILGYRAPLVEGRGTVFAGLSVLFVSFSYDHIMNYAAGRIRSLTEPFGFLVLTLCLGYVVFRRVATNQSEWMALATEMRAAESIQRSLLPASMPAASSWSVAARYVPASAVAGDFYGFPPAHSNCLSVFVADVVGHGVPAALVASMVKVSVFIETEKQDAPGQIMASLNSTLCHEAPQQYATAVYVSLDNNNRTGKYAAAGHPAPFLWRTKTQELVRLDIPGLLLGVRDDALYDETAFYYDSGDRILIYSDGLTEAENPNRESFGESELPSMIRSLQDLTAEQFADSLLHSVLAWTAGLSGVKQSDDITFVVIDLK